MGTQSLHSLSLKKNGAEHLLHIPLTSRLWEESFGGNSLMKSSRSLGWLVWGVARGAGVALPETPSALCLTCSFWSHRSFLKSLAFRHGGRLASAPTPARQKTHRGEQNFLDVPVKTGRKKKKKLFHFVHIGIELNKQLLCNCCAGNVCFHLFEGLLGFIFLPQAHLVESDCDVQVFFEGWRNSVWLLICTGEDKWLFLFFTGMNAWMNLGRQKKQKINKKYRVGFERYRKKQSSSHLFSIFKHRKFYSIITSVLCTKGFWLQLLIAYRICSC